MRRLLGSVLLASALAVGAAACGDSGTDTGTATDPTPSVTTAATDHELVEMLTQTAAGGEVGSAAALGDADAVAAYTKQFTNDALATRLQELVAQTEVPAGQVAYAAVVAIGCDAPTDVTVAAGKGGLVVEAVPVPDPKPECLAPMTTVAFLLVPADAV